MMHFICNGCFIILKALLTQWVSLDISVPDALPCSAIPSLHKRLPFFVVLLVYFLLVLLTVPSICQFRTACITAGLLWFYWQHFHHLLNIEKTTADFSEMALSLFYFAYYKYIS